MRIAQTEKMTLDGIIAIHTYYQDNGNRITVSDYVKALSEFLEKEDMFFDKADYTFFDDWAYEKRRTVDKREDISELDDIGLLTIESLFHDDENEYTFKYYCFNSDPPVTLEIRKKQV